MAGKSNYQEWRIQLVDGRTMKAIDDDSGFFNVLTASTPVEATIYSDSMGTAASNPGTMTDGVMRFWTLASVTSVDITVLTSEAHSFFLRGVSVSDGHITVWPENNGSQKLIIPYLVVGASEAVVDTGFDIFPKMFIRDCYVHVTTVGTGAALKIGTSTTNGAFASGVSVATTGFPVTLLDEALVSGSSLIGTALAPGTGTNVRQLHRRANATSGANIIYFNTTSSSTAGSGYIYLVYERMPTGDL